MPLNKEDDMSKWISVKERLPELKDDSVLVFFADNKSIDMVHIQDYFQDQMAGKDDDGNQLYSKWYKSQNVTHWMPLPPDPQE